MYTGNRLPKTQGLRACETGGLAKTRHLGGELGNGVNGSFLYASPKQLVSGVAYCVSYLLDGNSEPIDL